MAHQPHPGRDKSGPYTFEKNLRFPLSPGEPLQILCHHGIYVRNHLQIFGAQGLDQEQEAEAQDQENAAGDAEQNAISGVPDNAGQGCYGQGQ